MNDLNHPYHSVGDEIKPEPETAENENSAAPKKKKIIRHYQGINPEVELELEKVIDELQQRENGKLTEEEERNENENWVV